MTIIRTKPEPYCPECGGRMVLRKPKTEYGPQFDPFWGCQSYPDCRGKRAILEDGSPEPDDPVFDGGWEDE